MFCFNKEAWADFEYYFKKQHNITFTLMDKVYLEQRLSNSLDNTDTKKLEDLEEIQKEYDEMEGDFARLAEAVEDAIDDLHIALL